MNSSEDPGVILYGDPSAARTLHVYEDMRCSYCAELDRVLGPAMKESADDGTFKIAYHLANFLDRGGEHGGSTSTLAALGAAAAEGVEQFAALRTKLFEYRLENGTEGFTDPDILRGLVAQTCGVSFTAVAAAITEDSYRPWALETGPRSLTSLRAAWEAAGLEGKAGTPAAFLDDKAVEVLDAEGAPLSVEEFRANLKAALDS